MSRIVVFGAGGRAGRAAVTEARRRGNAVTAVVRAPGRYQDLPGDGVTVLAGDVLDAASVAELAREHDAAIAGVYDPSVAPERFSPAAATALVTGLDRAGVGRLVLVGLASVLASKSGALLMDTEGYPQEYRAFSLAHGAGNDALRAADTRVDWLVLSPSGDFDHDGERTGRYRIAPGDLNSRISYADLAVAMLDEIDSPSAHRTHLGVEDLR